jgi:hypothetical protein
VVCRIAFHHSSAGVVLNDRHELKRMFCVVTIIGYIQHVSSFPLFGSATVPAMQLSITNLLLAELRHNPSLSHIVQKKSQIYI